MDNVKMDNLLKIARSYTITDKTKFIELEDKKDGWSDGFIADFFHKETAKAKAFLKGAIVSESKPKIAGIIPDGSRVVDDVEYSLDKNCAVLKSKDLKCYINPTFIKYFFSTYKDMGYYSFKFVLTDDLKPVKVIGGDSRLLGLIMPIKV